MATVLDARRPRRFWRWSRIDWGLNDLSPALAWTAPGLCGLIMFFLVARQEGSSTGFIRRAHLLLTPRVFALPSAGVACWMNGLFPPAIGWVPAWPLGAVVLIPNQRQGSGRARWRRPGHDPIAPQAAVW